VSGVRPQKLMADAQKSYFKTAGVSKEDLCTINSEGRGQGARALRDNIHEEDDLLSDGV
jgi:hypothetical protein